MKRMFSAGLAILLSAYGFTMTASAAEEEQTDGEDKPKGAVESLTIEEAVDYALDDNSSLILLNYQLDTIRSQIEGAEDDYSDLEDDIDDLEDQMDDLREAQDATGNRTFQTRLELQNQIETMEDNMEDLEDSIREMDSNEIQLKYDRKQSHRSVELSTRSTFIQLLTQKDQIETTEASLENQKQKASNVKKQADIGTVAQSEYESAQREVRRLEGDLYDARAQYNHDLAMFALDLGIVYHDDLTLEAPDLGTLEPLNQQTETKTLIEDSFSMQNAKESLELAEYNREQVYDDDDATRFEEDQADINVDTEEENIQQLRDDLKTSIKDTFSEAETQYQAVLQAQDEVEFARSDVEDLRIQADIGVIPQSEYELAGLQVEQAEQELASARWNLYMINQQIEAMRGGLVQQSGSSSGQTSASSGQGSGSGNAQQ